MYLVMVLISLSLGTAGPWSSNGDRGFGKTSNDFILSFCGVGVESAGGVLHSCGRIEAGHPHLVVGIAGPIN